MDFRTTFAMLCSVGFLARFSYAIARNPVLPLFALSLGAGPEAVGLAVGISTVTGIFFKLPSGALSDVIGRRKTMLIGMFFFGLIPFLYLFIESYPMLVAVRFLHGFATAVYGPVAMAVVADIAGSRKGEMLSWYSSVQIVGGLLGAPIGGFILSMMAPAPGEYTSASFDVVYGLVAVTGLASLVIAARFLLKEEKVEGGSFQERVDAFTTGIKQVMGDKRVVVTSSMEGIQNMAMGALEAFLPVYAVTVAGLSAFEAGLLWAAQVTTVLAAKPVMGRISDKFGRKPLIVSGLLACAISFAAIPWLHGFWPLLMASLVFGLGEAFVTSSSAAMVADMCQAHQYGTAMGVFGTIFDVGHAGGPILSGILVGALGFKSTFGIMALVLLLAAPYFAMTVQEIKYDCPTPEGT